MQALIRSSNPASDAETCCKTTATINRFAETISRFRRAGTLAERERERRGEGAREGETRTRNHLGCLSSMLYEEWHIPHAQHKRITGGEAAEQTDRAQAKVQTRE